jgi:hypothetical protein
VRLLNYRTLALDELRLALGRDADHDLAATLRGLHLDDITSEDELRAVGAALIDQGGPAAVAGAMLVLIAGQRVRSARPVEETPLMRLPRPVERSNPSAADITKAMDAATADKTKPSDD